MDACNAYVMDGTLCYLYDMDGAYVMDGAMQGRPRRDRGPYDNKGKGKKGKRR